MSDGPAPAGRIDHIVVGAATLATGVAWIAERLGQAPAGGGAHPTMGTHNALWRLGACYLEVIAIDPEATPPARPRWFGLDDAATAARLSARPRLLAWVAAAARPIREAAALSPVATGPVERHHRGALHWLLTVPEDGRPALGGAMPGLIEWPAGVAPPPARMPDGGLRLARLVLPDAPGLRAALGLLGLAALVTVDAAATGPSATIATPRGPVLLD